MIYFSKHFTYEELIHTSTGLTNKPTNQVYYNLISTAKQLEQVRDLLKEPIHPTSGYRSEKVNKKVGGSTNSAHLYGYAVDFKLTKTPHLEAVKIISESGIKYDQLILEYGWIHISFDPRYRHQDLTKKSKDSPYLQGFHE